MNRLRIGTRKSPLALWQAEHVRAHLAAAHPGLAIELVTMTTTGDRILDAPLATAGGTGMSQRTRLWLLGVVSAGMVLLWIGK